MRARFDALNGSSRFPINRAATGARPSTRSGRTEGPSNARAELAEAPPSTVRAEPVAAHPHKPRPYARLLVLLALGVAACGSDKQPADQQQPVALSVRNYAALPLDQLYVHGGLSYKGAQNLLAEPLAEKAEVQVRIIAGQRVTVVRKKSSLSDLMSLTTAEPLPVQADGYTLLVFDESFRLMEPGYADQEF